MSIRVSNVSKRFGAFEALHDVSLEIARGDRDDVVDALDPDSDNDGLFDGTDRFVGERHVPALGDRILDDADACPLDAEDKDAFQDEDGCPDDHPERGHADGGCGSGRRPRRGPARPTPGTPPPSRCATG